jgi:hypothetical protein
VDALTPRRRRFSLALLRSAFAGLEMRAVVCVRWLLACFALGCTMNDASSPDAYSEARERMLSDQIEARGVRDPRVLAALARVLLHELVPAEHGSTPTKTGRSRSAAARRSRSRTWWPT